MHGVGLVFTIMVPSVLALSLGAGLALRKRVGQVSIVARLGQLISAAGVVVCLTLAVVQLTSSAGGATARPVLGMLVAVVFAVENGGYLWLVLRRPGPLGAWRHSGALGLAAALTVAFALFAVNQQHGQSGDFIVTSAVELVAILAPLAAGALAVLICVAHRGGIRHSLRSGAAECLWAVLLSPLAAFIVDLLTTKDDLGHAIVMLTGISSVFLIVLLFARALGGRVARLGTT